MKIEQLSRYGYILTDIFSNPFLEKIVHLADSFKPSTIQGTEDCKRESYFFNENTDLADEICGFLEKNLLEIIPYQSRGIELWRDYENFYNPMHQDDPQLQHVLIIYLDGNLPNGTQYVEKDILYTAPYIKNTGLLLLNSNNILHGMIGIVPENRIRKCLYLNWP